jgi:hypothetical protein
MFQLIDPGITAPVSSLMTMLVSDCDECGFNDLGKLLFGGLAAAILVGIAVSVIVRKRKESHAQTSDFVSIRETDRKR